MPPESSAPPRTAPAPGRGPRLLVAITASAAAGALVLQALALAAGGRDLTAGTTGPAIVGLCVTAALAAGLGRRWTGLRWAGSLGVVAAAAVAAYVLASAMVLAGWLAGFYHPGWTAF